MSENKGPGQVEITFEFRRYVGPRFLHAGLTLQYDALQAFSFSSVAVWPPQQNYEAAIREEVEAVLRERLGSLNCVRVTLKAVSVDDIDSSENSFRRGSLPRWRSKHETLRRSNSRVHAMRGKDPRALCKAFGEPGKPLRVRYATVPAIGGATRLNATNQGHPRSLSVLLHQLRLQ